MPSGVLQSIILLLIFISYKSEKIKETKVGNILHRGTSDVVKAIEQKTKLEVSPFNHVDFNAPPSPEEFYILSKLKCLDLSEVDIEQLLCPTNQEEISYILENERDYF